VLGFQFTHLLFDDCDPLSHVHPFVKTVDLLVQSPYSRMDGFELTLNIGVECFDFPLKLVHLREEHAFEPARDLGGQAITNTLSRYLTGPVGYG